MFFASRDEVKRILPTASEILENYVHDDDYDQSKKKNMINLHHHNPAFVLLERALFSELVRDFISGSITGAIISTIFYPLNVIRIQMQTQPAGSRYLTFRQAYRAVHQQRDGSFRLMYRGVHINYTRSFLSWGITNACYEFFRRMLNDDDHDDNRRTSPSSSLSIISSTQKPISSITPLPSSSQHRRRPFVVDSDSS